MKPDTSRWRERFNYDFFDDLPVEGLAWECLRRDEYYQSLYHNLVSAKVETEPLPQEAERRWGLRFRGPTWTVRVGAIWSFAARALERIDQGTGESIVRKWLLPGDQLAVHHHRTFPPWTKLDPTAGLGKGFGRVEQNFAT